MSVASAAGDTPGGTTVWPAREHPADRAFRIVALGLAGAIVVGVAGHLVSMLAQAEPALRRFGP